MKIIHNAGLMKRKVIKYASMHCDKEIGFSQFFVNFFDDNSLLFKISRYYDINNHNFIFIFENYCTGIDYLSQTHFTNLNDLYIKVEKKFKIKLSKKCKDEINAINLIKELTCY